MLFSKQFPRYESEATKFIQELKKQNPELEAQQRKGRSLLWDKEPVSLDTQERTKASRVKQQAYVYQNKG